MINKIRNRRQLIRAGLVLAAGMFPLLREAHADPYVQFFEAVRRNDARTVRVLILRGISTNSPDPTHGPAIVLAAQEKSFDALRALLESPLTDVNVFNKAGESALMYAALFGELEIAKLLVSRGAEVNHPGWTPLHYAASAGQRAVVEFLLEKNAYIDATSPNGTTPLMMAARENQLVVARYLVAQGADPSLRNEAGLGAPEYLMRVGAPEEAEWMRGKATEYLQRYGTKEAPVPAPSQR